MTHVAITHTTLMHTTPPVVWTALTDPEMTLQYWGDGLYSDWRPGSPVLWQMGPQALPRDTGQVVEAAHPPWLLAYTWHHAQPEHAAALGWSTAQLAVIREEPRTRVQFDLTPRAGGTELRLVHRGFVSGSPMLRACRSAWPQVLGDLKTFVEGGGTAGAR